jgi:uncharacterized protein YjiK
MKYMEVSNPNVVGYAMDISLRCFNTDNDKLFKVLKQWKHLIEMTTHSVLQYSVFYLNVFQGY